MDELLQLYARFRTLRSENPDALDFLSDAQLQNVNKMSTILDKAMAKTQVHAGSPAMGMRGAPDSKPCADFEEQYNNLASIISLHKFYKGRKPKQLAMNLLVDFSHGNIQARVTLSELITIYNKNKKVVAGYLVDYPACSLRIEELDLAVDAATALSYFDYLQANQNIVTELDAFVADANKIPDIEKVCDEFISKTNKYILELEKNVLPSLDSVTPETLEKYILELSNAETAAQALLTNNVLPNTSFFFDALESVKTSYRNNLKYFTTVKARFEGCKIRLKRIGHTLEEQTKFLGDAANEPTPPEGTKWTTLKGDLFANQKKEPLKDAHEVASNDIFQGNLGDCFFLAELGAVADADPEFLKNKITDNGDGTYSVKFFVPKPDNPKESQEILVKVTNKFPSPKHAKMGEKLDDKSKMEKELWVQVFEKAFAKFRGGYDILNQGGDASWAALVLTGKQAEVLDSKKINALDDAALLAKLSKKGVTVSLKNLAGLAHLSDISKYPHLKIDAQDPNRAELVFDKVGTHLIFKHEYFVQVKNGQVWLRNPHGKNHKSLSLEEIKNYIGNLIICEF